MEPEEKSCLPSWFTICHILTEEKSRIEHVLQKRHYKLVKLLASSFCYYSCKLYTINDYFKIIGKSLWYHGSNVGLSPCKGHISRYPQYSRVAKPTQSSILLRSVNEYRIILGLTPSHQQLELILSVTTRGITNT